MSQKITRLVHINVNYAYLPASKFKNLVKFDLSMCTYVDEIVLIITRVNGAAEGDADVTAIPHDEVEMIRLVGVHAQYPPAVGVHVLMS